MTYALDTNTISYILRGEGNANSCFQKEIIESDNQYVIPHIVNYEIKRWLLYTPTKMLHELANQYDVMFRNVIDKADMSCDIWEKAADIYIKLKKAGKIIGDADILISAYCLVNNYTLVTSNTRDFSRINDLKHVDWNVVG